MDHIEHITKLGHQLFNKRGSLLSLWQIIAENFYPERADFEVSRALGDEFGSDLMSSYPVLVRRDLGDSLSSMLRPTNKEWFHHRTKLGWEDVGPEGRAWLEDADNLQRRVMYSRSSGFTRATKEADHDFVTFGQAVMQITMNRTGDNLLFRTWHLRDCAWMEDENGMIATVYRKWTNATIQTLSRLFPGKLHPRMMERLDKEPFAEVEIWHVVMPGHSCPGSKYENKPFVSYYIDVKNKHIIEEAPLRIMPYLIPRWRTVSGSQYAVSPATCVALADARLLQAMVGVLLEAGEKAVNPPLVANKEVFGGDFAIYPGGLTWADSEGRISDHFQQLPVDKNGIPLGIDMARDVRMTLAEAFYLNKLSLPPVGGPEMTAYEVGQRVQEYIRQALPLFEPMEFEYNGPLCDVTFDLLMQIGAFGSELDIPRELRGKQTEFTFESPLHDAIERARGQQFLEAKAMIAEAVAVDPSTIHVVDIAEAFRDALEGSGTPSAWIRPKGEVEKRIREEQAAIRNQQMLEQLQQGADIAKTVSETGPIPAGE